MTCQCREGVHEDQPCRNQAATYEPDDILTDPQVCTACLFGCLP